jgi:hypothetical protein
MSRPDAIVTIAGGVADVTVRTPGFAIEVRDYDVDGVEDELLWTDENGDRCVRYFAGHDPAPTTP